MAKKGSKGSRGKRKATASKAPTISRNSAIAAVVVAAGMAFVIGYVVGRGRPPAGEEPGEGDIAGSEVYRVPIDDAPTKGPRDALVTVVEFSDFECPHCAKASKTIDQLCDRFEGKVRVAFRHAPLPSHRNALAAAEASLAANEQGRFWEFHDQLFANQDLLREKGTHYLLDVGKRLDLDMDRFRKALEDHRFRKQVLADKRLLADLGQRGTPMFFVNGRLVRGAQPLTKFVEVFEREQRRAEEMVSRGTSRTKLYDEIIRNGILPGRERRGQEEEGERSAQAPTEPVEVPRNAEGPGLGPPDAPVHVVEFFDFQCPACKSVPPELHKLHEEFPAEVRIEFRQFPLSFHKAARPLSEIALAANEQGLYVEAAEAIFESQSRFSGVGPDKALDLGIEIVSEVEGLDVEKLRRDIKTGRFGELIDRDFALGQKTGLRGTPTIYINGRTARGRSFLQLSAQVRRILDELPARPGGADAGASDAEAGSKAPAKGAPGGRAKAAGARSKAPRPAKTPPAATKAPRPAKTPPSERPRQPTKGGGGGEETSAP